MCPAVVAGHGGGGSAYAGGALYGAGATPYAPYDDQLLRSTLPHHMVSARPRTPTPHPHTHTPTLNAFCVHFSKREHLRTVTPCPLPWCCSSLKSFKSDLDKDTPCTLITLVSKITYDFNRFES